MAGVDELPALSLGAGGAAEPGALVEAPTTPGLTLIWHLAKILGIV